MAQRPRIGQLKRTDLNYATFQEQYETLEHGSKHMRSPVQTKGALPFTGNLPGSQCLVLEEGAIYYWDEGQQNWRSSLGQAFELPDKVVRRHKKKFKATAGQTDFVVDVRYTVGYDEVDVFVQGMLQDVGIDYIELDERTIQFLHPLEADMEVTIATPMIIQESITADGMQKRLEELEHNHYQLMMSQYYTGKPVEAKGMVYDGFLNTGGIDYVQTSLNVEYDHILKTMRLKTDVVRQIVEQFDSSTNIQSGSSVYVANSEMTLGIDATFAKVFADDFSSTDFLNVDLTNAFHDLALERFLTTDTGTGGDHYYKGDFMSPSMGPADGVGFSNAIAASHQRWWYYAYTGSTTTNVHNQAGCHAILAMSTMTGVINSLSAVYRSAPPFSNDGYFYKNSQTELHRTDGDTSPPGPYPYNTSGDNRGSLLIDGDGHHFRQTMTYVRSWNKIIALKQYNEGSGTYYQRLSSAAGQTNNLSWVWHNRPAGLPKEVFGSELTSFTKSEKLISQIGATYDHLLLRIGNELHFLDGNLLVQKTLDWTNAERIPSNYNVASRQITADRKYLYFPARLNRNGYWGYYLEVFNLSDGSFVGEILVTRDNSGVPGTTAMGFDHTYNRLILGVWGGMWPELHGKTRYSSYVNTSYAGFLMFQAPDLAEREVYSKAMTTNLPVVKYRLGSAETLNGGTIDYFIRFGAQAWTKISRNTIYTWTNPGGAKETTIELRAVMKTALNASTSPVLTGWQLEVCPFVSDGLLMTKEKLLTLTDVTGGRLLSSSSFPNETSLNWSIKLDTNEPEIQLSPDGLFSTVANLAQGNVSMIARLGTNNKLLSPVVQDFQTHFHRVNAGVMVTNTFDQLGDVSAVDLWVTTGTTHEYYNVHLSRDGGETWTPAVRSQSVKLNSGSVETLWKAAFTGTEMLKSALKIKFEMTGVTEIQQYGAKIR